MQLALAVSQQPPELPAGEQALLAAFAGLGIAASAEIWSSGVDWSRFQAVVIRSCWDYHLRVDEFREWIHQLEARKIPVINPAELIRWNIDKHYLHELSERGVTIPDTLWLGHGERIDLRELCHAHGWPSAVVKPLISASAYRTERKSAGVVEGPLLVQEYVAEIESGGEWSLMYFQGAFSHAVRKRASEGDFRVQKEFGGTAEAAAPPSKVRDAAEAAIRALARRPVFARVDLVERGPSVVLMELELIEPELFVTHAPGAARRLALAIQSALAP